MSQRVNDLTCCNLSFREEKMTFEKTHRKIVASNWVVTHISKDSSCGVYCHHTNNGCWRSLYRGVYRVSTTLRLKLGTLFAQFGSLYWKLQTASTLKNGFFFCELNVLQFFNPILKHYANELNMCGCVCAGGVDPSSHRHGTGVWCAQGRLQTLQPEGNQAHLWEVKESERWLENSCFIIF